MFGWEVLFLILIIMEKRYIEYRENKYPVYEINLVDIYDDQRENSYTFVAGDGLLVVLEDDGLYNDNVPQEVIKVDNQIFFYCDDDFFNSNPTYEELIEYLKENLKNN